MRRVELERLFRERVLVPGPDGPCDAQAKARMRRDYLAYHERTIEYGRARRAAQIEARRSRCPKTKDPT